MTKKKLIIIGSLIVVAVIFFIWRASSKNQIEYVTTKASRINLLQTVTETGTIKPIQEIALNFNGSGRISKIFVEVGDKVSSTQVLAELDHSDLSIKQEEAQANVNISRAQLDKLLAGASAEEIAVAQANFNEAQTAYQSAQKDLEETKIRQAQALAQAQADYDSLISNQPSSLSTARQAVIQSQTALDNAKKTYQNAIDNKSDALATTMTSKLPTVSVGLDAVNRIINDVDIQNNLSKKNSSYLNLTNSSYAQAKLSLSNADIALQGELTTIANLNSAYKLVIKAANDTFKSVNYCFSSLEASITSSNFSQASLDAFKTTISTHSSNLSSAISALQSSKQSLDDALLAYDTNVSTAEHNLSQAKANLDEAITRTANALANAKTGQSQQLTLANSKVDQMQKALNAAQAQLNKITAPARSEDITLQRAQVAKAVASLDLIKNQLINNSIIAPTNGIITKVNYQVGEQASQGEAVMSMITENSYEIAIDVSETDIAKLQIGNQVSITLDAYGDDQVLTGLISFIEPAETVIQGVTYYKVKITFSAGTGIELKPGLTATAKIVTAQKDDVIAIPQRAVSDQDGQKIVKTLVNGSVVTKVVSLGLSGDGGLVEIISGLNGNEEIITSTKTNGQTP